MIILVTGGAKCGKSKIAEDILRPVKEDKFYIATMENDSEEAQRTIYRHRQARADQGFLTIERTRDIGEIVLPIGASALLECIPTLTANEMFTGSDAYPVKKVITDVTELAKNCETLVIITNDVGSDGVDYPSETAEYVRVLGQINILLADFADVVIEAVHGIPVVLKGELS